MPNTASAIRRVRRVIRQTTVNRLRKSKYKAAIKKMEDLIKSKEIEKIKNGCQQILEGKGFRKQYPISNLGIKSFYKLFELFHFELINQKAIKLKNGHFLDKITFEHIVDKSIINYYNLV